MDDLLSQFEKLLDDCRYADKMLNNTEISAEEAHWRQVLNISAVELYDFLIEHGPTVTFTAPAEPSAAATFDPHKNFVKVKGGWDKRKDGDDDE